MGRPTKPKTQPIRFLPKPEYVEVEKLKLDYGNVRILHVEKHSEKQVEETLWKEAKLQLLYEDIKYRGLQDPLILHPKGNTIAEGNCRLVCLRKLHTESQSSDDDLLKQFKNYKVKCYRIDPHTPAKDLEAYLANIHVGQKKEWPDYNQSELMHRLYAVRGLSLDEISGITRKTKSTVLSKIAAFESTNYYHEIIPNDKNWHLKFPHIWEFLRQADLEEFREDEANVKRFMKWLYKGKFKNSKDVRLLGKIIRNKAAQRQLELKDATEAITILLKKDPTIKSPTFRKIVNLITLLEAFPTNELIKTVQEPSRKDLLVQLKNSVTLLLRQISELEETPNIEEKITKDTHAKSYQKLQLSAHGR